MTRNRHNFKEYIMEQIRQRYVSESKIGCDNNLIFKIDDTYRVLNNEILKEHGQVFNPNFKILFDLPQANTYSSSYFIPDWMESKGTNIILKKANLAFATSKQIPFASKKLKTIWKKIEKKQLKLVVVGFGGAMSHVLYNLYLLKNVFRTDSLFNEISIFENDNLSLTNLLRFNIPIIDKAISKYKYNEETLPKLMIAEEFVWTLGENINLVNDYFNEKYIEKYIDDNTIVIGAPDFNTRKLLKEKNIPFLFIGHGQNEVSITYQPEVFEGVRETYGTVDVPILTVNLYLATIAFLDILEKYNIEDLHELQSNEELFNFNFDDLTENEIKKLKKEFINSTIEILENDDNDDEPDFISVDEDKIIDSCEE